MAWHAEEAFVDGSCSSCRDMTMSELRTRLRYVKHGGVPLPLPQSGVCPGTRCVRWSQGWFEDCVEGFSKWSSSPLKHSAAGGGAFGLGWDLCRAGYTTCFLRCSPWQPDVDRCIRGLSLSLREWRIGYVAPFRCSSVVCARPRDDSYAFLGRRECRARLESWIRSQYFEVGWVVFSVGVALVLSHSSPKCMRSLQDRVRHLWLPESLAGLRYLVRLGGSCGPSVSAMRFSLPGMPPSSGTSGSLRSGFYSPYFIVPEKSSGLRTILDLQVLNRALHKLPFKMLTQKGIFGCVRPLDWFAAIDLKDAYFHVYILLRHSFSRDSCSRVGHIITRSCLLGYPGCLASSPKSWRWPLFPWENEVCASSTTSTTGSYLQSLTSSCAHTGTWYSGTSASWVFGSTGKRAIFSRHGVGFGQPDSTPHPGSCSIGGPYRQCDDRCVCQLARWFTLPSQLARLPTAEREGCLQAKDGPVYSGCHHLGLRSTRCALPAQVACSLY